MSASLKSALLEEVERLGFVVCRVARADAPELRRTQAGRSLSGERWIGLPARDAHVVTSLAAVPLLPDWLAVVLLLGLVVLAWWREAA